MKSDKSQTLTSGNIHPALRQATMGALFDALHHMAHMKTTGSNKKPKIQVKNGGKMPPPYKK